MIVRVSTVLFVVAAVLSGCAPSDDSAADAASTAADSAAAVEAIKAQAARLSEAYMAGDIDGVVALYTADGIAAAYNSDFVRGTDALLDLWQLPEGRTIPHHASMPEEIVVDGDHAWDWGYYEGEAAQDGESLGTFGGKYVIVWERGTDGVWRMALDVWSGVPTE